MGLSDLDSATQILVAAFLATGISLFCRKLMGKRFGPFFAVAIVMLALVVDCMGV